MLFINQLFGCSHVCLTVTQESCAQPAKLQGGWPQIWARELYWSVGVINTFPPTTATMGPWTQIPCWLYLCEFPEKPLEEELGWSGKRQNTRDMRTDPRGPGLLYEERTGNLHLKCGEKRIYGNVSAIWEQGRAIWAHLGGG